MGSALLVPKRLDPTSNPWGLTPMQAIEINAIITPDHEIRVRLPDHVPPGPVRVIVLFESDATASAKGNLDDFLDRLPINRTTTP